VTGVQTCALPIWHISRFHPDYKLLDRPVTPHESLLAARDTGRAAGLRFVYVGNASGPGFGDTPCPGCGTTVIRREGFRCSPFGVQGGTCLECGADLPGVWA
jgi:pyruvate formate lyase activating enzyme